MKRYIALLLSVLLLMSMTYAGSAFAGQPAGSNDSTVTNSVYDSSTNDNSPVETTQTPSDLDNSNSPTDIVPGNLGQEALPSLQSGSVNNLDNLAGQVDEGMAGSGVAEKLQALVKQIKAPNGITAARLVYVSLRLRQLTKNNLKFIDNHPRVKLAIVLMTDETVRLAHNKLQNQKARLAVYNNAVHTYSMLGCYKRAAAVMERALKLAANRAAAYSNLIQLYKKAGANGLKVFVRGQRPNFDVPPMTQNDRTLVPIRTISEAMGAKVSWDQLQQKVMINNGSININLFINKKGAIVNGKRVNLDAPAQMINGRTMVPLRFISESMGAKVNWDGDTKTVTVE